MYKYNPLLEVGLDYYEVGAGSVTFLSLTDTPSSYSGQGLKGVRVNVGATALEFYTIAGDTDEKVGVDSEATPDYIGTTSSDGVLRVSSPITYADGGDYITLGIDETAIDHNNLLNSHNLTTDIDHGSISGLVDDDHTQYLLVDGTRAMSGNLNMGSNNIVSLATPTGGSDATTKDYVDSLIHGLDWQDSVLDKDLTAPPGGESPGDRYIVGSGATGDWSGHDDDIAEYNGSSWDFTTPDEGFAVWVEDENILYVWNGSAWVKFGSTVNHGNLIGLADDDHPHYLLANGNRALAGAWNMGSQILTNVNIDSGNIDTAVIQTEWDAAYEHISSDGSNHTFIDQSVVSGSSPTFGGANFTEIDISDATNLTAGRSLALTDDTIAADVELYTHIASIALDYPKIGDSAAIQLKFPNNITITRISGSTDQGNVTIQFDERAENTPNTGGVDVMTAALVCDNNTQVTTDFANAGIAGDAILNLDIDATASAPTKLRIHVEYTYDD